MSNQRLKGVVFGRRGGVRCPQRLSTFVMIHDESLICGPCVNFEDGNVPAASLFLQKSRSVFVVAESKDSC